MKNFSTISSTQWPMTCEYLSTSFIRSVLKSSLLPIRQHVWASEDCRRGRPVSTKCRSTLLSSILHELNIWFEMSYIHFSTQWFLLYRPHSVPDHVWRIARCAYGRKCRGLQGAAAILHVRAVYILSASTRTFIYIRTHITSIYIIKHMPPKISTIFLSRSIVNIINKT